VGPGPTALQKPSSTKKKGASAYGSDVTRLLALAADEIDGLSIGDCIGDAAASPRHADQIEKR
jgi:hypothetical protein